MPAVKDASHLYEVEHRAEHAARPGFRITELKLSGKVLEGELRIFLQQPKQEGPLAPGETFTAAARRPHLVLQGLGEYDFVPLLEERA